MWVLVKRWLTSAEAGLAAQEEREEDEGRFEDAEAVAWVQAWTAISEPCLRWRYRISTWCRSAGDIVVGNGGGGRSRKPSAVRWRRTQLSEKRGRRSPTSPGRMRMTVAARMRTSSRPDS